MALFNFCKAQLLFLEGWKDFLYDACGWDGARAKSQFLCSNVAELRKIECQCIHLHDPDEWKPQYNQESKSRYFLSHEAAEYTAELVFAMAILFSFWAVRVGKAKLKIFNIRVMRPGEVGLRLCSAREAPELCRQGAMLAIGVRRGVCCPAFAGIPVSHRVDLLDLRPATNVMFIGQHCKKWKLDRTRWSSQFLLGPHGDDVACTRLYYRWFLQQPDLIRDIPTLKSAKLVCICIPGENCHG